MELPPRRSNRTVLWGALFGILFAILIIVEHLFQGRLARAVGLGMPRPALALFSPVILFIVGMVCFFCAGLLAAHRTRQLSSGLLAGLIAGVIAAVVGLVIALHGAGAVEQVVRHAAASARLRAAVRVGIAGAVLRAILAAMTMTLVGAGMGALGGLTGRGSETQVAARGPLPYAPGDNAPDPHPYEPATPHTYIQGNDHPTVQTLRQE